MEQRDKFEGVNSIKFYNHFRTDEDCYKYLSGIKWDGDSFVCKKCGNTHYCKGHLPYSRRCTRCKYDESPTAGTMFDKVKFFYVAIQIIGKYLLFLNCFVSNSYTISREYDDFRWSRSYQPITLMTGTEWLPTTGLPDKLLLVDTDAHFPHHSLLLQNI